MNIPPTIRSGEKLAFLDGTNDNVIFTRAYHNKILAAVNAFLNLKGLKLSENNSFIETSNATAPETFAAFAITELGHQDYFVARQLSNFRLDNDTGSPIADVGATDIKIAKVKNVRRSILTQSLYGSTVTYSDNDPADIDNTRNADDGMRPTENQVCLPPYLTLAALGFTDTVPATAQCVVYAKKVAGLTGVFDGETQLDWLEDAGSDGVRAFAKVSAA